MDPDPDQHNYLVYFGSGSGSEITKFDPYSELSTGIPVVHAIKHNTGVHIPYSIGTVFYLIGLCVLPG